MDDLRAAMSGLMARRNAGIKFDLSVEHALLDTLGRPDRGFRAVHVAGTNGKGSVCAMVASMARALGLRTGLFTSPHVCSFAERFQIDGQPAAEDQLRALIARVTDADRSEAVARTGRQATFFEFVTAMAFEHFREQAVDLAVVETGMGGRLDATNVLAPDVAVVTNVALEHTAYLGPDVPSIAAEKAGIVKPGVPVVVGPMPGPAQAVVRRCARERGARVVEAAERVSVTSRALSWTARTAAIETRTQNYGTVSLPLVAEYQLGNCGIAVAAAETLCEQWGVEMPVQAVRRGLAEVVWPARFQVVAQDPVTVVDGAHNPSAARALAKTLRALARGRPVGFVVGMCRDKDARGFMQALSRVGARCWCVPIAGSDRGCTADAVAGHAAAAGLPGRVAACLPDARQEAQAWARRNHGVVCVTGSLFLAGEALNAQGAA